jgi:hypothetical protein
MTTMLRQRRSRIAQFKAPFILSVASSAAIACGGKADVGEVGQVAENGGAPDTRCPEDLPAAGAPCSLAASELCSYTPDCPASARCVGGEWSTDILACNPPAPEPQAECPSAQPSAGSDCSEYASGLTCEYAYCYGSQVPMVVCADYTWQALPVPSCNPPAIDYPPPVEACPESMPEAGSDCTSDARVCGYPGCGGEEASTATCHGRQWLVEYSAGPACNPPAVIPICPSIEPVANADCAYDGQSCMYGVCGDPQSPARLYVCGASGWVQADVNCVPPNADDRDAGQGQP